MRRRTLLAVAGWLAAVAVATLIGVGAIRLVGESITGTPGGVLSQGDVARALASPTPTAGPQPSGDTGPTAGASPGTRQSFSTTGGSVVAECAGGLVTLTAYSPAQGYEVTDADRGPDDDAEVKFRGPGGEVELHLVCVDGVPTAVNDD
jgi:hypothetical protein